MKNILLIGMLILAVVFSNAQEKRSKKELKAEKKEQQIILTKKLVEDKAFTFIARSANPMRGRTVQIANYPVRIKNDTIYSHLPYFGRATNSGYNTDSRVPFDFTLPIDSYTTSETKKGFRIKVGVKNSTDKLDYTFNISEDGSTTLSVTSVNRDQISYRGEITHFVKPGKK